MNRDNKILRSILKTIYPERYLEGEGEGIMMETTKPCEMSENEVKTRMAMALQHLKLSFRS
jgi:hypothetical protein